MGLDKDDRPLQDPAQYREEIGDGRLGQAADVQAFPAGPDGFGEPAEALCFFQKIKTHACGYPLYDSPAP